jgi:hypothetical protein
VTAAAAPVGIGLFPLLAVAGLVIGASSMLAHYTNNVTRDDLETRANGEIERIRDRISKLERANISSELQKELDQIQHTVGEGIPNLQSSRPIFEELRDLSLKVNRADLDETQRGRRIEAVKRAIAEIKASGKPAFALPVARLEDEIERIDDIPAEDRMTELQRMLDELGEMIHPREPFARVSNTKPRSDDMSAEERVRLQREIRDWVDRIAGLDETEGKRLSLVLEKLSADTQFPNRIRILHKQMKTTWGALRERAASSACFRDILLGLRGELDRARRELASDEAAHLVARCDATSGAKFIERTDFMKLYEDIVKFAASQGETIADAFFAGKVKESLEELGYELVSDETEGEDGVDLLRPGSVRYLETPYDDYRVMARVDKNGSLATRLVRAEDEEPETASQADKTRDREIGERWCRDFDAFLNKMKESGIPLDVTVRHEPNETAVIAAPDKIASKKRKSRKAKRKSEDKRMYVGGDDEN